MCPSLPPWQFLKSFLLRKSFTHRYTIILGGLGSKSGSRLNVAEPFLHDNYLIPNHNNYT